MREDLLICAAVDLSGGGRWFEDRRDPVVGSLKLGLAGNIQQGTHGAAFFATRRDSIPGSDNPRVSNGQFCVEAGDCITLLAGRILEPERLLERLGIPRPASHSELYAAAYAALGEDCDAEIVGHYAALQYFPASGRVRLARSPLGAPPLHVWRDGPRLVAASLPRTLFAAGAPCELDRERLEDIALLNFGDGRASFYRGLSRVGCGWVEHHALDRQEARQFWSVDALPAANASSPEEAIASSRELLDRAVCAHMQSCSKPALSLSGGLDSQAVASATLRQTEPQACLKSYTSVPLGLWHGREDNRISGDERGPVEELAAMYPTLEPCFVEASQDRFAADLDKLVAIGSWPSFNEMNMHWVHAIYRQARADGCDALLTGDYGDPGLSYDGLTGFSTWLRRLQLRNLWRELRAIDDPRSLPRKTVSLALLPLLPQRLRHNLDRVRGFALSPFVSWSPLDRASGGSSEAVERARNAPLSGWGYRPAEARASRARMLAPGLSEGPEIELALRLLHGVSTRDPLAFRPLFDYVAGLPDELFFRGGTERWLAREVVRGRVPDCVVEDRRVAVQSSDFFDRLRAWGADMIGSIKGIPRGSIARQVIDLDRIESDLEDFGAGRDLRPYRWYRLASAVPRGIALARFAQHVEGRNDAG